MMCEMKAVIYMVRFMANSKGSDSVLQDVDP